MSQNKVSFKQPVASGTRSGAQNQQLSVTQGTTHAPSEYNRKPDYERGPWVGKHGDADAPTLAATQYNKYKGLIGRGGKRKTRKTKKAKKTRKTRKTRKSRKSKKN